jgi:uncharacterized protein (TIGR02757 family)
VSRGATSRPLLQERLDGLAAGFDRRHLHPDPLEIVLRHRSRADREVAGLVAAGLAFGAVRGILRSVEAALAPFGSRPARALDEMAPARIRRSLSGFRHRWLGGDDVAGLLVAVRTLRRRHGSLHAAFRAGDPGGPHVGPALEAFSAAIRAADPGWGSRGAAGLVPSPVNGSACKRPLLYLRWMIRDDGVDTGAWKGEDPSRLLLPLDTHLSRITRALGLLRRKTDGWGAVVEVTEALRQLDPADPVRYDFALCRLGILDLCPRERDRDNCRRCDLYDVCAYGAGTSRTQATPSTTRISPSVV